MPEAILSLAFASDGRRVLAGTDAGKAVLWDRTSGEQVMLFGPGRVPSMSENNLCVAISPDGKKALLGSDAGTAILWDLLGDKLIRQITVNEFSVNSVGFSPDGRSIVTGSVRTAIVWDTATGKALSRLHALHTDAGVVCASFWPDGKHLLAVSDGAVILWVTATGSRKRTFKTDDSVLCAGFSSDGSRVLAASPSRVVILDSRTWSPCHDRAFVDDVTWAALSPNGEKVLICFQSGELAIWERPWSGPLRRLDRADETSECAAFSPDGKVAATGRNDGRVLLWDTQTGKRLRLLVPDLSHFRSADEPPPGGGGGRA